MKKNLKLVLTFVLALVLTGCMKVNMVIDVDEKGKAELSAEVLYSEEMLDSMGYTVDQMNEQMTTQMGMADGSEYEEISKTIDGEKYVGASFKQETNNDKIAEVKDGKVTLTIPADELSELTGGFDESSLSAYGYSVDTLKKNGVEMNMVLNMPGKAESNVGKVDGSKVTIDLFDLMVNPTNDDIVITSSIGGGSSNTILYIGIAAAAVVVIGVAFVLVKKNKNKNDSDETVINDSVASETPIETAEPVVEEKASEPETVVEEPKDTDNQE